MLKQKSGNFNWPDRNINVLKRHLCPSGYQIPGIKDHERNGNSPGISRTEKEKVPGRGELVSGKEISHTSNRWPMVGRTTP